MLDKIIKNEIDLINKNRAKEINSVKYIVNLIQTEKEFFSKKFKNHSEEEIYQEIKTILNQMYKTYETEKSILMDNVRNRSKKDIEKSVILGFETITGNPNTLDGYYDEGEILKLTEKGKEVLNNYRLARKELIIEDFRKYLIENFYMFT